MFVHIRSTDQFLRPVPHGQPCSWVVEENAIISCPHDTPETEERTRGDEKKERDTCFVVTGRTDLSRAFVSLPWCSRDWVGGYRPGFLSCPFFLCHLFLFRLLNEKIYKFVDQYNI